MTTKFSRVGKKIREFRMRNNDTLVELAKFLNMDVGNLSKVETGKRGLPPETLNKIADKYKLSPDDRTQLFVASGYSRGGEGVYKNMNQEENRQVKTQNFNVPNNLPVLFSDSIGLTSSKFGLVFDFGQRVGPTDQVNIVARIGLSKEHAEALIQVLAGKIKEMQLLTDKGNKKSD